MRSIPLTQNKTAYVDDADYNEASKYTWYAMRSYVKGIVYWYAARTVDVGNVVNKLRTTVFLHQMIVGTNHARFKNGNGLDCQRHNIEIVSKEPSPASPQSSERI